MIDDVVDGFFERIGWGLGTAVVAAAALIGSPRARPLAKGAIKGYLTATTRARGAVAEATESMRDVYAEAKHEHQSQGRPEPATGSQPGTTQAQTIPVEVVSEGS